MNRYGLTNMEGKFADIIWANEPVPSGKLVKLCAAEFNWKKSTTYTMLKRLEDKGVFANEGGMVSSLLKKDEYYAKKSERFVEETFAGSLPRFVAAFTRNKRLSDGEIAELQRLIDEHGED